MKMISPTPHRDVNEILDLLLRSVKETLGDQFVGMYLYGSLSSGDFNPETSDIDFLVVTKDSIPESMVSALHFMHQRIWASGLKWASRLEGAYIPRKDIRRHGSDHASCPIVNEGKFYIGGFGSDWVIQRHVVRECGVVVDGPDPRTLIDPVGPEDIRRAVLGILDEWWFPMLGDPSWLQSHGAHYHGFTVITMCRALYALQHGRIVSKPAAVEWAKAELGSQWYGLIERAVAAQDGKGSNFLSETLEFIRFTREQIWRDERLIKRIGSEHAKDSS
ncbi:MAG TPA: aminoglycoside adenylyltransferase domain-containing protein [Anaerolineales bacterium]|nr:aminoglycoside adenylyltransferase domain-containing protein [Anaerolineales bacterium]